MELFMSVFIGFIVVVVFWFHMKSNSNLVNKKFGKFANDNGFTYIEDASNSGEIYEEIGIFKGDKNRSINNLLKKNDSLIFNYQFIFRNGIAGFGPNKNSYVVFQKKLKNKTPNFYLKNESFGDKIDEKLLGFIDIDFDENKEFSKKFFLRGKEVEEIKEYFNDLRKEKLVSCNLNNGFQLGFNPFKLNYEIQVNDNVLYIYTLVGINYKSNFNLSKFVNNTNKIYNILN